MSGCNVVHFMKKNGDGPPGIARLSLWTFLGLPSKQYPVSINVQNILLSIY